MENKLFKKRIKTILAIDEVGRGSLAGPFYVGGLFIDKIHYKILEKIAVKDSKKLNPDKRFEIYKKLKKEKFYFHIVKFSSKEVDKLSIGRCFIEAIYKLNNIYKPDLIIVDGKKVNLKLKNIRFFIDGDELIKSISAISIISKVLRDRYMIFLDRFYPPYKFKKNKGYGTKEHIKAIKKYGLTKHHRSSFCKFI